MESTVRSNLTSFIKTMIKEETVETNEQFKIFIEKVFQELSNFDKFMTIHKRNKILEEVVEEVIKEEASMVAWELALAVAERMSSSEDEDDHELPDPELPEPELPDPQLPDPESMEIDDTADLNKNSPNENGDQQCVGDEVLAFRKGETYFFVARDFLSGSLHFV